MTNLLFQKHLTTDEIASGMETVLASPADRGSLRLIVARPAIGKRTVLHEADLDADQGLIGDNWSTRGSKRTANGGGHPDMQINIMNARFAELVAGSKERIHLAGDQLFVDLDLSRSNLPPLTRLAVGTAVLEITAIPHLGCKKFVERFGTDAMRYANSEFGRRHNLRGVNAKVVRSGRVQIGDAITKFLRG